MIDTATRKILRQAQREGHMSGLTPEMRKVLASLSTLAKKARPRGGGETTWASSTGPLTCQSWDSGDDPGYTAEDAQAAGAWLAALLEVL